MRTLVYVLYAVLLTTILLYVRFPVEKFHRFCVERIERLLPDTSCTIGHLGYRFPFSAVLDTITLTRSIGGQDAVATIDNVVITPRSPQFWRSFTVKAQIYSGKLVTTLNLDHRAHSFQLEGLHGEGIELGALAKGMGIEDRQLSGTLGFFGDFRALYDGTGEGSGKGTIEATAGQFTLMQPILGLQAVDFSRVSMRLSQQNGILRLEEGNLAGRDITADYTGEVRLASPLITSTLSLGGQMQPEAAYLQSNPPEQQIVQRLLERYRTTMLPFKVGGTVQRPLFRFSM